MKTRIRIIVIIAFSRFSVNISRRSVSRIRMYSIVIEESLAFHFNSNHRRTTLLEQSNETSAKDIHETNKKRSQPSGAAFPHFPHSFVDVFVFMLLAAFPGVLYRTENTRTPDRKASSLSVSKSTKVVLKLSSAYYVYENMRTKGRKRNVAKCKWMLVERMFKDSTLASGLSYDEKGKKLRRPRRRRQKLLRVMLVCESRQWDEANVILQCWSGLSLTIKARALNENNRDRKFHTLESLFSFIYSNIEQCAQLSGVAVGWVDVFMFLSCSTENHQRCQADSTVYVEIFLKWKHRASRKWKYTTLVVITTVSSHIMLVGSRSRRVK